MLTPPRVVLFDLDGTLADSDAALAAGVRGAAQAAHELTGVPLDAWLALNSQVASDVVSAHLDDWVTGAIDAEAISREIYGRMLVRFGADPAHVHRLVRAQAEAGFAGQRAFPDVAAFLEALAERGLRTGVITNGSADIQRASLAAIGLGTRFDSLVFSSEHGIAKPDPAVFRIALDELRVEAGEAWFIGDNPATDIAGAVAAGVQAVWLNRPRTAVDGVVPAFEIASLAELVPLLD